MPFLPRTLRARVTVATAAVLTVVLGFVGVFVDQAFRRHGLKTLDEALRVEAQVLAVMVRINGDQLRIDTDGGGRLDLFEPRGRGAYYLVTSARRKDARSPSLGDRAFPRGEGPTLGAARGVVEGGPAPVWSTAVTRSGPFEPEVRCISLVLRVPVGTEDDDEAKPGALTEPVLVEVARSTKELDRGQTALRGALSVALPLGLVLGALGAFLLARRATSPIGRLTADARAIGAATPGTPAARLDVPRVEGELRDLAEMLNDAFARLETAVQRERRFSADASHELRTPLAVLRSRLELMLSRDRSPDEYREALRTSLDASLRLEQIVRSLLLLARADAGAIVRGSVDLPSAVARAVAAACASVGSDPAAVDLHVEDEGMRVAGEAALLERMVSNVVENALTHGAGGGPVEVTLDADGDEARLTVADRGPGLPADLLPRLFERFARGDASRTRATGGAGLGLSIARSIARLHGGDATAGPRTGGGTQVEIRLPRARTTSPVLAPSPVS